MQSCASLLCIGDCGLPLNARLTAGLAQETAFFRSPAAAHSVRVSGGLQGSVRSPSGGAASENGLELSTSGREKRPRPAELEERRRKQSSSHAGRLDCRVASAPRNDGEMFPSGSYRISASDCPC